MLEQLFGSWWPMVSSYFGGPLTLASGRVNAFSIVPTLGLALLLLGLITALAWREKQAVWVIGPALASSLTPVILAIANILGGWFVVIFALIIGAVALLLWIGVISADATRRLPVWLLGLFALSFVLHCGLISVALIWGIA
jgi:FtsH-binding integral membrane protein